MDLRNYGVIDFAEHIHLDRLNAFDDLEHVAHVDAFWNSESKKNKELLQKNLDLTYEVDELREQKDDLTTKLKAHKQTISNLQTTLQENFKVHFLMRSTKS